MYLRGYDVAYQDRFTPMALPLLDFTWFVANKGHRWVGTPAHVITDGLLGGEFSGGRRDYAPLREYPALFRNFAFLEAVPDRILAFADTYGLLGTDEQTMLAGSQMGGRKRPFAASGERLTTWQREIRELKRWVTHWDLLRARDLERLRRRVAWNTDLAPDQIDSVRAELRRRQVPDAEINRQLRSLRGVWGQVQVLATDQAAKDEVQAQAIYDPGDFDLPMKLGDVEVAGWAALFGTVTARLEHQAGVRIGLAWDSASNMPTWRIQPTTLLDALWLQFARAIAGNREYRRCENPRCGEWFEVSSDPRAGNRKRKFCLPPRNCRLQAHRARHPNRKGA